MSDGILAYLDGRGRLEQPSGCPDEIYQLMMSCWDKYPESRKVGRVSRNYHHFFILFLKIINIIIIIVIIIIIIIIIIILRVFLLPLF